MVGQPPLIGLERLLKDWVKAMITGNGGSLESSEKTRLVEIGCESMTYGKLAWGAFLPSNYHHWLDWDLG